MSVIVITNPTAATRELHVLAMIPDGALPTSGGSATESRTVKVDRFGTATLEMSFYFPRAGSFQALPAQVGEDGRLVGAGEGGEVRVVDTAHVHDKRSWDWVSQASGPRVEGDAMREERLVEGSDWDPVVGNATGSAIWKTCQESQFERSSHRAICLLLTIALLSIRFSRSRRRLPAAREHGGRRGVPERGVPRVGGSVDAVSGDAFTKDAVAPQDAVKRCVEMRAPETLSHYKTQSHDELEEDVSRHASSRTPSNTPLLRLRCPSTKPGIASSEAGGIGISPALPATLPDSLSRRAWRMKDGAAFQTITSLLRDRRRYSSALWAYSLRHGARRELGEWLRATGFVSKLG